MQCAADPGVETELRCGKCGTPICPRCMVQTPVGARCRNCAQVRRPVMYRASPVLVARGYGAAIGVAIVVGALWAFLLPRAANLLGFLILFAAAGYGWLAAEVVGRATNRRRGTVFQSAAVVSCVLVYLVHNLLGPANALIVVNDLWGYVFVVIAAVVAANYLR